MPGIRRLELAAIGFILGRIGNGCESSEAGTGEWESSKHSGAAQGFPIGPRIPQH